MKICSTKDIKAITGIMAAAMLLGGCSAAGTPGSGSVSDPTLKENIINHDNTGVDYDADLMDKGNHSSYSL